MSSTVNTHGDFWILEPRDTLLVRDGRPNQSPGEPMRTLDFPWPSTVAGMARTRCGQDADGRFGILPSQAREIEVAGPLLAQLNDAGEVQETFYPGPLDCAWKKDAEKLQRWRLVPKTMPAGAETDLQGLALTGPAHSPGPTGKIYSGPDFWRWSAFEEWLCNPRDFDTAIAFHAIGLPKLVRERRVHVAIAPTQQTAQEGMLFATEGLRFVYSPADLPSRSMRLALTLRCGDPRFKAGLTVLGGERRTSFLRRAQNPWPGCLDLELSRLPASLRGAFPDVRHAARVILLTPALFEQGAVPIEIAGQQVLACAVPRPLVISGWDYEQVTDAQGRKRARGPKPTRRAVAAGSVYWVRLPDDATAAKEWVERTWLSCISDDEQDRRDGFGLCVLGVA